MREDRVPLSGQRRPRDDTLRQAAGMLACGAIGLAALGILYLIVRLDSERVPALEPSPVITPAPAFDEAVLAQLITAGVAAAIGSPQPLRGEIVMLEPTPTATPVRPVAAATTGPMTCPRDPNVLPVGSICLGTYPPRTPTPIPACIAPPLPGVLCEVRPGSAPEGV